LRAPTEPIPSRVEKFLRSLPPSPVALIGCRASDASLDCCEYDIAVFAEAKEGHVIRLDGQTIELLYFAGHPRNAIVDLYGMRIARDSNKFALASAAKEMTQEKFKKALRATGRKSLVSSLFCQRMAHQASGSVVGQMWGKIAAYRFVSGAIALSGKRPMPMHELGQARQMDTSGVVAEGLAAALECIGLERATRPSISRSIQALQELKSKDYDKDLVVSKIEYLMGRQMLSDCYFFMGRTAAENLVKRKDSFHHRYSKLVQLALDLTSDTQQMEKSQRSLFKAASAALKE